MESGGHPDLMRWSLVCKVQRDLGGLEFTELFRVLERKQRKGERERKRERERPMDLFKVLLKYRAEF
jgi:hypothetical protein